MPLYWTGRINPGKVFDLTLPLEQVAEGYRAMDEAAGHQSIVAPVRNCTAGHITSSRDI